MNNNKYVIAISYGDYTQGTGGTDKVIMAQQALLNNNGYEVIHISHYYNIKFWNLLVDGKFKGIYSNHRLKAYLYSKKMMKLCAIFIHHLKDTLIREVQIYKILIFPVVTMFLGDFSQYTTAPIR